ncbi:unnamed protein product [Polarella glacialis]|uniref:RING-type domain-containing protein n=1 Tax=Polarella glacialis TaxID=89957 RepID=A0A813LP00_POLGL|nr:unnamed protein product [Polarella glacialis]
MLRKSRSVPRAFMAKVGTGRLSESVLSDVSDALSSSAALDGLGVLGVVGKRCLLYDRPGREYHRERSSSSMVRSASGGRLPCNSRVDRLMECGLSEDEVLNLLYRELTPEDYETLCRLDELLPKKTADEEALKGLKPVSPGSWQHDCCGVCLMPFQDGESEIVAVPCPASHEFHRECVSKWLLQCKNSCPVDHAELW